jgi:hypothetical protein
MCKGIFPPVEQAFDATGDLGPASRPLPPRSPDAIASVVNSRAACQFSYPARGREPEKTSVAADAACFTAAAATPNLPARLQTARLQASVRGCRVIERWHRRHRAENQRSRKRFTEALPCSTGTLSEEFAQTASLTALTGRALMSFRAGLALNIVGSFVNGLMPLRALVAGFLTTTNFAKPGSTKAPLFLSSL